MCTSHAFRTGPTATGSRPSRALLLVGHGSQLDADSADPVYRQADSVRGAGAFDEVAVAFWKEDPPLRGALSRLDSDEVAVVPLLLADGYFNRTVIPRELGVEDEARVHYAPPLGGHPSLADLVEERALAALQEEGVDPRAAELVVAGHGTPLDRASGGTTWKVAGRLHDRGRFGSVTAGFLDQEPGIAPVVAGAAAAHVVVVPFFLAEGWHTQRTIPETLGLSGARTDTRGRVTHYTPPVGTHERVGEVVLALAEAAFRTDEWCTPQPRPVRARVLGSPGRGLRPASPERRAGSRASPCVVPAPREVEAAFVAWLEAAGPRGRTFLQALVRRDGRGGWEVLHRDDRTHPPEALREVVVPGDPTGELAHPLVALARRTSGGLNRPLRSAPDLRAGWIARGLDPSGAFRAVSALYPADVHRWTAWCRARLEVVPWEATAGRQSGRYAAVAALSGVQLGDAVRACCDSSLCLRTPLWPARSREAGAGGFLPPPPPRRSRGRTAGDEAVVPCGEACTLFVSFARVVLALEGARRRPGCGERSADSDGLAGPAALRRRAHRAARSGEVPVATFDDPANPRRLRYLAEIEDDREQDGFGERCRARSEPQ